MSNYHPNRSPRQELQGPRPTPLRVRKDSHKIGKSSMAPHVPPPPVIIYTVSPKVIHANPNEFMSLVQRLTGPAPTSTFACAFQESSRSVSPAASIEKTKSPIGRKTQLLDHNMEGIGQFQGILSPNPNALPPIPPNFFSPSSDCNPLSFFYALSPNILNKNKNSENNSIMPTTPSFISPNINMPSPNTLELFNTLFDL